MAVKGTKRRIVGTAAKLEYGSSNFNECRAILGGYKSRLAKALKSHGSKLRFADQKKYLQTFAALTTACALVQGIPCTGQFMSLDLPKYTLRVKPARTPSQRRRR